MFKFPWGKNTRGTKLLNGKGVKVEDKIQVDQVNRMKRHHQSYPKVNERGIILGVSPKGITINLLIGISIFRVSV